MAYDCAVVGGGVVGISVALELQLIDQGEVVVIDSSPDEANTSQRNAGAFAFSDVVPLATPGIIRNVPRWLLDPTGPLSISARYIPKISPWLLRFWRASWRDRYQSSVNAQVQLMNLSRAALERQVAVINGEQFLQREGQLQLFEGQAELGKSWPDWEMRRNHGINFQILEGARDIAEIQPGISNRFTHAGFTPEWINTCDPAIWLKQLKEVFLARGGKIVSDKIRSLSKKPGSVALKGTQGEECVAKQAVVAAGAWSHHLAWSLGDKIPLETERGYNTTLPQGAFDLRTHLTFGSHGFVVSRINSGVRVGGGVELAGLKARPDYSRADQLLRKAVTFLPGLKTAGGEQWMGFRPSLPDSLPVISKSPNCNEVIYAFGHGHLGLTQSAGTAEIVAHLVQDLPPPIDTTPFASSRFKPWRL